MSCHEIGGQSAGVIDKTAAQDNSKLLTATFTTFWTCTERNLLQSKIEDKVIEQEYTNLDEVLNQQVLVASKCVIPGYILFRGPEIGQTRKHCSPTGLLGFQSTPTHVELLTQADLQSSTSATADTADPPFTFTPTCAALQLTHSATQISCTTRIDTEHKLATITTSTWARMQKCDNTKTWAEMFRWIYRQI